jgi:hypothetical protein
VLLALASAGCGSGSHARTAGASAGVRSTTSPKSAPSPPGPAFGLTEDNAQLLWSPERPAGGARSAGGTGAEGQAQAAPGQGVTPRLDPGFARARERLTALHPTYVRLLVDWAALQPDADRAPALAGAADGCARAVGPCGAYEGLREELAAIASQQRAARQAGQSAFQVVLEIFGTPAWAARGPSGCELAHTQPFSRPINQIGLDGYRALIRALIALGAQEGVELKWWSPWNEPNDAVFLSPQRASCTTASPSLAPAVYAQLAQAMSAELQAAGGDRQMLLGELNAFQSDSPHRTSLASFIAALPPQVLCLSEVWSIHVYAARGPAAPAGDPVAAFEAALDAGGECGRKASVWITEAGAGAPHPGRARPLGAEDERAGCVRLASQLAEWSHDPRVGAVFQYSFREDPDFPVGLLSADLSHVYPAYRLWLAYARARARGSLPDSLAGRCA